MKEYFSAQPFIDEEDIRMVTEVLRSGHLEEGAYVRKFEELVSQKLQKRFAKATVNGFSSIHIFLLSLNIGPGDEVIIPSYCCPAVLFPIELTGAKAVYADIGDNSFSMSVDSIKKVVSPATKVIIYPYQFGFPGMIDKVLEAFPGLMIIEDIAQGLGTVYKGKLLGTFARHAIASFYASKTITSGDGGMALTNSEIVNKQFQYFTYYGGRIGLQEIGFNYHTTNLNAALGISQFSKLEQFIAKRKQLAAWYHEILKGHELLSMDFFGSEDSGYLKFPVLCSSGVVRDYLKQSLKKRGIHCGFGVLEALHIKQEKEIHLPNTEKFINRILCLPIYPSLEKEDIEYIGETVLDELKYLKA